MKKPLITPTFLKQKARHLKKEKSVSWSEALKETAIQFGFANYKHFLNEWESNRKPESQTVVDALLRRLTSEQSMSAKLELAIPFVQRNKMSFPEMFDIFEQFSRSREAVQAISENSFFLDHVVSSMLLEYFRQSKDDVQALPLREHFIAKDVIIESLECELITERLNVKGLYTIEFEFEHMAEVEDDLKMTSHFNRDPMFGQFEMTIDRNRQVTIANPTIGEIDETGIRLGRFKLGTAGL